MDGMDEWRFADANSDADEARYEQQKKIERKNTYCNIIRDYGKLREIAAKIINALGIKDEEADEVTQHDIKVLYVDDSHTMINIEWAEVFDGTNICRSVNDRVTEVPAEWFAVDEDKLPNVVKSYKKQMGDLIEGLMRDLAYAEEQAKDAKKRVTDLKSRIVEVRDSCGLWS